MRILAIRGEGLASLAEPFEIDLTREPLAGTGLFAITGDTGAGKSTILDCLCLALYGDYPRIAAGRQERVLDPSGQAITAANPVNIMHRGSAHAVAEVDFVGRDAIAYRARWQVRRARGRANGRPQDEERRLDRLDGPQVIATGKSDVAREIVERTGLTFDQFRRTVLLAQGEFDAFLLADESQRAALLEKITGTGIYAEISRRIHAEARAKSEALQTLRTRRDELAVLAPEARAELEGRRRDIGTRLAAVNDEVDKVRHRLALARRHAEARAQIAAAMSALEQARDQHAAANPDRVEYERLLAAEPHRAALGALTGARGEMARRCSDLATLHANLTELEAAAASNASRIAAHSATAAAEQHRIDELIPQWAEAERADHALAAARAELASAEHAAAETVRRFSAAKARVIAASDHTAALERDEARLAAAVALTPAHTRLATAADRLLAAIDERQELVKRLAAVRSDETNSRTAIAAIETIREQLAHDLAAGETKLAAERQSADRIAATLNAIDETATDQRAAQLAALEHALKEAGAALLDMQRWTIAASAAAGRRSAAIARAAAARETGEAAERRRSEVRRAIAEIANLATLADATLSTAASRLRETLSEGEPCPVCGSPDHPAAAGSSAHLALAHGVRARRAALIEQELADTDIIEKSARAHAVAEAEIESAAAAEAEATAAVAATAARQRKTIADLAASGGDTRDLALIAAADVDAIAAQLENAAQERRAIEAERRRTVELRREAEAVRRREGALAAQIAAARQEILRVDHEHAAARRAEAAAHARMDELQPQIARLNRELADGLRDTGIAAADFEHDPAGTAQRIRQLVAAHHAARQALGQASGALASARSELVAALAEERALAGAAGEAETRRALRAATVEAHANARRELLGGMATAAHRDEALRRRDEAVASRDRAREEGQRLALELRGISGRIETATIAKVEAEKAALRLHADFEAACASLGVDEAGLSALLAVDAVAKERLAGRLAALEGTLADAERAVRLRAADIAALDAEGGAAIDPSAETERLEALAREADTLREDAARVAFLLDRDRELLERVAAIDAEIAAAAAAALTWQEVDAAVGSADGSVFRRFVQGITLEHLVALANADLARLAPRYALTRSTLTPLALHVIDDDLGGELRSLRGLSGGERFLVSLALALALSKLEGGSAFVDTLVIDEGFGALDAETLDVAIDALEQLQGAGRKVGVITHVAGMIERIAVQVRVVRRGGGRSVVRLGAVAPALPPTLLAEAPRARPGKSLPTGSQPL